MWRNTFLKNHNKVVVQFYTALLQPLVYSLNSECLNFPQRAVKRSRNRLSKATFILQTGRSIYSHTLGKFDQRFLMQKVVLLFMTSSFTKPTVIVLYYSVLVISKHFFKVKNLYSPRPVLMNMVLPLKSIFAVDTFPTMKDLAVFRL